MSENKIRAVLSDSDPAFLSRLKGEIDWAAFGFEIIAEALSKAEMLQMLQSTQADILFVNRSFLADEDDTGSLLRKAYPEMKYVVFLESGDVRSRKGKFVPEVLTYIVKPFGIGKLSSEMKRVYHRYQRNYRASSEDRYSEAALTLVISSFLMNSFEEPVTDEEMIAELMQYGFEFGSGYKMIVLAICIRNSRILPPELAYRANQAIRKSYSCGSFILGNRIISLLISNDNFEYLEDVITEVRDLMSLEAGGEFLIGSSETFRKARNMVPACVEAVNLTRVAERRGVSEIRGEMTENRDLSKSEESRVADFDALLTSGNREDLEEYLVQELTDEMSEIGTLQILLTAYSVFTINLGNEEAKRLLRIHQLDHPLSETGEREMLRHRIISYCLAGNEEIIRKTQKGMEQIVNRTVTLIDSYYMENTLSLDSISKHLHVTPNYLSAQIKKYRGENFSDLLIRKRMETARSLLETSNLKVAEIAERCGYADPHYFSTSFKNYYGISPLKVRRNSRGNKETE